MHRDCDLHYSLVKRAILAPDLAPDLFENVMGVEVAALIEQLDAVLKQGLHAVVFLIVRDWPERDRIRESADCEYLVSRFVICSSFALSLAPC